MDELTYQGTKIHFDDPAERRLFLIQRAAPKWFQDAFGAPRYICKGLSQSHHRKLERQWLGRRRFDG